MKTTGSLRIADRYVTALFEAAQSAGALDAVENDMRALQSALEQNQDFAHFLGNPLLPRDHQADAVVAVAAGLGVHTLTRQFLALLATRKRLVLLPDIAALMLKRIAAQRGRMTAEVISADPLPKAQLDAIAQSLATAYGKSVDMEARQDASLLGGFILKVGSLELDNSLAGKMRRLGRSLKAA